MINIIPSTIPSVTTIGKRSQTIKAVSSKIIKIENETKKTAKVMVFITAPKTLEMIFITKTFAFSSSGNPFMLTTSRLQGEKKVFIRILTEKVFASIRI